MLVFSGDLTECLSLLGLWRNACHRWGFNVMFVFSEALKEQLCQYQRVLKMVDFQIQNENTKWFSKNDKIQNVNTKWFLLAENTILNKMYLMYLKCQILCEPLMMWSIREWAKNQFLHFKNHFKYIPFKIHFKIGMLKIENTKCF